METHTKGELDNCKYLIENTLYDNSKNKNGYWPENHLASNISSGSYVNVNLRYVSSYSVLHMSVNDGFGIRPVIEVLKSEISY